MGVLRKGRKRFGRKVNGPVFTWIDNGLDWKPNITQEVTGPAPVHEYELQELLDMESPTIHDIRRYSLSADLIARVGMWSDCNVTIQHYVVANVVATKFQLWCSKCGQALPMKYDDFQEHSTVTGVKINPVINMMSKIQTFCQKHRHSDLSASLVQSQQPHQLLRNPNVDVLSGVNVIRRLRDE